MKKLISEKEYDSKINSANAKLMEFVNLKNGYKNLSPNDKETFERLKINAYNEVSRIQAEFTHN